MASFFNLWYHFLRREIVHLISRFFPPQMGTSSYVTLDSQSWTDHSNWYAVRTMDFHFTMMNDAARSALCGVDMTRWKPPCSHYLRVSIIGINSFVGISRRPLFIQNALFPAELSTGFSTILYNRSFIKLHYWWSGDNLRPLQTFSARLMIKSISISP